MTKNWIDEVKFNSNGLVPVVAQDFESGRVLMLAWANAEALHEAKYGSIATATACSISSRKWVAWPATPDARAAFTANLKTTNGTPLIRSLFRRVGYMLISVKDNASSRLRAASCYQGT